MLTSIINKVQTSTTSLTSTVSQASSDDGLKSLGASVRRLSVPLGKARQVSQRRLSQMVSTIGEVIDQEIDLFRNGLSELL